MSLHSFTLITLGCKVNQYDGAALAQALRDKGLRRCPTSDPGELIILNSCCVTGVAMAKSRNMLRRMIRRSPESSVLLTGCFADYDPAAGYALLEQAGVPPEKFALAGNHGDALAQAMRLAGHCAVDNDASGQSSQPPSHDTIKRRRVESLNSPPAKARVCAPRRFAGRNKAFVKVQDGCDAFCSYCIVPFTRPHVWSKPIDEVVEECQRLIEAGHREIVLCGIFLGAFGRDTTIRRRWDKTPSRLPELLDAVAQIDGLWRVRLSSIEPLDVTDDLLGVIESNPNVAPHFHMPLQSGSADILRRMNRQYNPDQFYQRIAALRDALDSPAITTDVIVGFPGESDQDFEDTLDVLESCGICNLHAFAFSPIDGTSAWNWRDARPKGEVVHERLTRLDELRSRLASEFRRRFVGKKMSALTRRSSRGKGEIIAMTDREFEVTVASDSPTPGQVVQVVPIGVCADTVSGELA